LLLNLTAQEKEVFAKLSPEVQKAAKVEMETLTFEDSDEKLGARIRNCKLQHPELKKLQERTKPVSPKEMAEITKTINLDNLSKDDFTEIAFAWGPNMFTAMLSIALPATTTEQDVAGLSRLTHIRHGLLLSMQ
jgi:hypothetical protein